MDYEKHFETLPLEKKRQDLMSHPMIDKEKLKQATDEQIEVLYHDLFSSFDMAMREVLGESMFEE